MTVKKQDLFRVADKTYNILRQVELAYLPTIIAIATAICADEALKGNEILLAIPTILFAAQRILSAINKAISENWNERKK